MAEKLVLYKCEHDAEPLELSADRLSAKCKYCGRVYYFKKEDNSRKEDSFQNLLIPLNRANDDRLRCDFYDAIKGYKSILAEYPNNAEANWGLVLSLYGIEYVKDARTQKYIPTCHRVVEESILNHPNYLEALKNAAPQQVAIWEEKAKQIDKIQKAIKRKMEDEEEFEVFISFKSKDAEDKPTPDSVIGRRIRDELENRGIKTFFSDVTLEDRMGDEYEPIIYKALHTCKAFILVGTSKENINAPWVKNEWSRFEERIEKEHLTTGTWFAVFDKIRATDFPGFLSTQGFDLRNYPVGYEIKIADAIALKLGKTKKEDESAELQKKLAQMQEAQKQREEQLLAQQRQMQEQQRQMQEQMKKMSSQPQETGVSSLTAPLLKRMDMALFDRKFADADKFAEKVLDLDPENVSAYLGKLLAESNVSRKESLKNLKEPFDNSDNYKKVVRFGSEALRQELTSYLNAINKRILEKKEAEYSKAMSYYNQNTINGYKNAINVFSGIKYYKDSGAKIVSCNQKITGLLDAEYDKAVALSRKRDIESLTQAIDIFRDIEDHRDSKEQIQACYEKIENRKKAKEIEDEEKAKKGSKFRTIIVVIILIIMLATCDCGGCGCGCGGCF